MRMLEVWLCVTVSVMVVGAHSGRSHAGGAVLRTLLPTPLEGTFQGPINNHLLFFNLSSIPSNEVITRARIHFHRRRITWEKPTDSELLPTPGHIMLYQTRSQHSRRRQLVSLPVTSTYPGGWQLLDITAPLQEIHARPLLLAVGFENPDGFPLALDNYLKPVKSKKRKSWAYIVVISKPDADEGLDELKERHLKHKESKADGNEMKNEIQVLPHHLGKEKVRRTKEAEQQLRQRNFLHSLPFLHVGEIADLRRSTRKAKRFVQLDLPQQQKL